MLEILMIAPAAAIAILYGGLVIRDWHRENVMSAATRPHDLVPIGMLKQSPAVVIAVALAPSVPARWPYRFEDSRLVLVRDGQPEAVDPREVWEMMESRRIIWQGMRHQEGYANFLRFMKSAANTRPDLRKSLNEWNAQQHVWFICALPFILVAIWLAARWANSL